MVVWSPVVNSGTLVSLDPLTKLHPRYPGYLKHTLWYVMNSLGSEDDQTYENQTILRCYISSVKQCEAGKSTSGKCMFGYTLHVRLFYN